MSSLLSNFIATKIHKLNQFPFGLEDVHRSFISQANFRKYYFFEKPALLLDIVEEDRVGDWKFDLKDHAL
jgi:hypothetical protein